MLSRLPFRRIASALVVGASAVGGLPVGGALLPPSPHSEQILALDVPTTSFVAGTWGMGVVMKASGFRGSAPITLVMDKLTSAKTFVESTKIVESDPEGDLATVWAPSAPPEAPDGDYPRYIVWARQEGDNRTPALCTNTVRLTITAV